MTGAEIAIGAAILGAGAAVGGALNNNQKAPSVKEPSAPPVTTSRADTGAIVKLGADSKNETVKSSKPRASPRTYDFLGALGKGTGVQV